MYETLLRPHEVNQAPRLVRIGSVAEKLKQQERNREDKRQRQIAASRARRRYYDDTPTSEKRKRQDDDDDNNDAPGVADLESEHDPECSELEAKKAKTTTTTKTIEQCDEDEEDGDDNATSLVPDVAMDFLIEEPPENEMPPPTDDAVPPLPTTSTSAPDTQVLSRHSKEVRGHTSFLTFACLLPLQP
jgi:tRNA (adenine57-N1/adenine58-N1)-methyltransferase catalytic subunit